MDSRAGRDKPARSGDETHGQRLPEPRQRLELPWRGSLLPLECEALIKRPAAARKPKLNPSPYSRRIPFFVPMIKSKVWLRGRH